MIAYYCIVPSLGLVWLMFEYIRDSEFDRYDNYDWRRYNRNKYSK